MKTNSCERALKPKTEIQNPKSKSFRNHRAKAQQWRPCSSFSPNLFLFKTPSAPPLPSPPSPLHLGGVLMADKENIPVRITRSAAAKRSAAAAAAAAGEASKFTSSDQPPQKRKRVALGELPIPSNAALNSMPRSQAKTRSKKKRENRSDPPADPGPQCDIESRETDPQMCPHYASDIYQYLRSMEVCSFHLICISSNLTIA